MQLKRYIFSLLLALIAFSAPVLAQCPNQAFIDLLQQSGNTVTVGTTLSAPVGNSLYAWDFGDSFTQSGQFVSHTYNQPGVYVISLTIYDSLQTSWCAYGVLTVQVNNACDLNPTFTASPADSGMVAIGNVQVQNAVLPITYQWWFSNGQSSNQANPVVQFANGSQSACLNVTDASGCVDSVCTTFQVNNAPCPTDFVTLQQNVNQQQLNMVALVSSNMAMPLNIHIDYGDGTTQDGLMTSAYTANHAYPQANTTYLLCITVEDANGCVDMICQPVVTTACASLPVTFQSYSSGPGIYQFYGNVGGGQWPYTYSWNLGNGQIINSDTASYTTAFITIPGLYQVCLTVTDANGCMGTFCQSVNVTPCGSMNASMNISNNGLSATAMAVVTGGCSNYTYLWQSMGQTSSLPSPTFTYTQAGTYDIILQVSDACGCVQTITGVVTIACGQTGGQTVLMQTGTMTLCNATFFDSGGNSGMYQNNEDYTLTIFPATPGAKLRIALSNVDVEAHFDYLKIHNGPNTNSPLLANFNGISSAQSFTSTSEDGSLTFHFTSDFTVTKAGWSAQISCVDLSIGAVNQGSGSWMLSANSVQSWTAYSWSIDGVLIPATSASFTYTMPEGMHQVCVTGVNALGCTEQVCSWVDVPCTYNVDFQTAINGNEVTVTIANYDTLLYYSIVDGQNWQQVTGPTTTLSYITGGMHQLCVYSDGICPDSSCVNVDLGSENTDIISGYLWDDANGNGLFESNESAFSNVYVQLCQTNTTGTDTTSCLWIYSDTSGYYSFNVFPGSYALNAYNWQAQSNLYVPTLPANGGGYAFTTTGGTTITGFDFGYQNQAVVISGLVFYDNNNNGVQDLGEGVAQYQSVHIGNYWVYTNANGVYTVNIPAGAYVVSVTPGNGFAISVPASPFTYTVNASSIGQTYGNNNFGLWADPNLQDLSASISPISTVTPGFPVMTHLSYCNNGAVAMSGTFSYYWDPQLAISSPAVFNPAPSTFSAATNSATWNFSNLGAGQCSYIYQNTTASVSLVLGTPVFNTVIVTPLNDSYPSNNIDTLHQNVVGSWDPNDKQGTPSGVGEAGSILPNTRLSYTIRFQNTGSAPAVNVVLIDTLSSDFVLESFAMNAASDAYTVQVNQDTRVAR